ncbi:uncharacterized protein FIESC28_10769 [Fusarium coffeatum]|uniref:Helicase ATP-binding domain-containing protein n=1 Tax=Fusarium coffeatum TaxID=231269 RepID=A0A366QTK3_9HYPO|nr:uncharacterized protein FIESC28_10769 [Fusarium coffeatum]RBR07270.1 hypothetical protein FIESC28_10769 [Fusarium coffeatum]
MGPSKRQLCYENDTEDGNTPKRLGYGTSSSNASRSEPLFMDVDPVPSANDGVSQTTTAGPVDERICYGTVDAGACYLAPDPNSKTRQRSFLDENTGLILTYVTNKVPQVSFLSVVGVSFLSRKRSKTNKLTVQGTINVYGPRNLMGEVDRALSDISSFLQHPVFLEPGVLYINPQFFYSNAEKTDLRHLVGPPVEDDTYGTAQAVDGAMEYMEDWSEDAYTGGLRQSYLHPTFDKYLLATKLKDLVFQSGTPGLGGILADVMGLGKTLTMLTAILCSRGLKERYSSCGSNGNENNEAQSSNLTLVVLPSRQLLDVWRNEIDEQVDSTNATWVDKLTRLRRFQLNTFQTEVFHGHARARNAERLLRSDIVLTTYHTLEKDSSGKRILDSIRWSRIVLDEGNLPNHPSLPAILLTIITAHHIRNPSTRIHKAIVALQRETRWCLTGTPIQNSLDDLRSLLNFLQFEPFCQSQVFEEYIVKPFRQEPSTDLEFRDPSWNLRALLKACCLRRTQTKLDLPETYIRTIGVVPTEAEKAMFKGILLECREEFDRMAGREEVSKKSNILFSAIMKLRRVCNHGAIGVGASTENWSNYLTVPTTKRSISTSLSSEPACEFCTKSLLEDDLLDALDSCPLCSRILSDGITKTPSAASSPQDTPSPAVSMMDIDSPVPCNSGVGFASSGNRSRAQSSKLSAVIDNIKSSCLDADSKSVVFSSWRDTLDILATMLTDEGIGSVQVDGRNPLLGRTALISTFRQDPLIKVLLISINTGAVGLTLTEANKVHIIEPQWNPTIEEQAIARVVRMGQTRPVTVFKYITEESVEQSIVKVQEKKTRIIKLSMQDKDNNGSDANLDRFKFTLDPNEWKADL